METYDGIEHLAQALTLSAEWRNSLFAMSNWIGNFDASGKELAGFIVVAGFVSTAERWIGLESAWRERLDRDGINYFHMVEFAHSAKQFENGWKNNEARRRALLADLVEIIKKHVFRKFGHVIMTSDMLGGLSEQQREQYFLNGYSLAGLACAVDILRWRKWDDVKQQVILVFEKGDVGRNELVKLFSRCGFPEPHFKPKKDTPTLFGIEHGLGALQAADLFAYEAF